ncbi:hypothetical protein D3C77_544310 [compost metagenome]
MSHTLTQDKVELIEKSELNYMLDRMKTIQERPGNPEGVETMPWPAFNTVKGINVCNDSLPKYRTFR